jgi:restriction endonuclease Mrr
MCVKYLSLIILERNISDFKSELPAEKYQKIISPCVSRLKEYTENSRQAVVHSVRDFFKFSTKKKSKMLNYRGKGKGDRRWGRGRGKGGVGWGMREGGRRMGEEGRGRGKREVGKG